jgi:ubiquinone/menaquinone biosynthesis C-methylase UbiE
MEMERDRAMTAPLEGRREPPPRHAHRCPAWAGPFMASPLRRLLENPEKLLAPWVEPGMTVLDVGCATGFFSLPLARMTGPTGRVVCVDVEPRMVTRLLRRATKARLINRIEPIVCGENDLGLSGREATVDLAVAIHSLHELPDIERGLRQIAVVLKPGGRLLLIEPRGHVSAATWTHELDVARVLGFSVRQPLDLWRRHAVLLQKG